MQHYVINFLGDFRQVGGFHKQYNWNIVKRNVKRHNLNPNKQYLFSCGHWGRYKANFSYVVQLHRFPAIYSPQRHLLHRHICAPVISQDMGQCCGSIFVFGETVSEMIGLCWYW